MIYYQDDTVTIYHGDCREITGLWPDVMLTDPPYGVGKAAWDIHVWPEPPASLKAAGIIPGVSNIGTAPDGWRHLTYRWTLAAHLTNGMTRGAVGFGNWIPCLLYAADDVSLFAQAQDCASFAVGREVKPDHPSPKPLNVMRWFLSRLPDGLVLDPFMGSGTTLRAAKDLGRKAIGIEIEERYCEIAAKRCAQEVLALDGA